MGDKNKKDRKKRALGALLALRKHLKAGCDKFSTVNDWNGFIRDHVDPVIDAFYDDLPSPWGARLRKATELTDNTRDAIDDACSLLDDTLEGAVKSLAPKGLGIGSIVSGGVLVGLIGGIVYLSVSAVSLTVKNQGCEPLLPSVQQFGNLPTQIFGLSFPDKPIPSGASADMKVPGIQFTVDGTSPGAIRLTALMITFTFTLNDPSINLLLDGQSLVGQTTVVNLGASKTHELVVICR